MLNTSVLVLNRLYQPVHVTSVRRAFSLLYQGIARAIDDQYKLYEFSDWAALSAAEHDSVATISRRIRVPRVLVLSAYEHLPKGRVRFSRLNIYSRDGDTCQYCARKLPRSELNLDHVLPRDRGGLTTWENVVCSCIGCNTRKGNRLPHEAHMKLIRKPKRPKWRPFVQVTFTTHQHESWRHFVDLAYWNVELSD